MVGLALPLGSLTQQDCSIGQHCQDTCNSATAHEALGSICEICRPSPTCGGATQITHRSASQGTAAGFGLWYSWGGVLDELIQHVALGALMPRATPRFVL